MDVIISNQLAPGKDYGFLELAHEAGAWPRQDDRARALLISFNTPGYYSIAVRLLALTAHLSETVQGSFDVRYTEADIIDDRSALAAAVTAWDPDIIALSVNIWNLRTCLEFVPELKRALPNVTIIMGGQEVSGSVTDFLPIHPGIDYIIEGEGEIPFLQFLASWEGTTRSLRNPKDVSGLRYRNNGTVALTGPAQIVSDLDALPSPILAGLVPVRTKNKLGVMLEGARGCPYQCSFCFEGSRVTKVRMASIERLSAEARHMAAQGASYFHLLDPILCNSKPERLKGIADLFKDLNTGRKMQISLETYAQHINDQIAPYLADLTIIDVGLQSINPATQKEIRRSFSMDRFRDGLASLRKVNPNFNLYLICGLPHETLLSFLQGIEFVVAERPVRMFINELCLLNGTELRRRAADYGYDYDPDPPYRVHASKWMSRREIQVANALANVAYRRYNFSVRALFPLAPWVKNAPPATGNTVSFVLSQGSPDVSGTLLQRAAGADAEVVTDLALNDARILRLFGQLQLLGAARLRVTAPLRNLAAADQVEKLVSLGVLHFKTFWQPGSPLEPLQNITRTFSMKGYASLRPFVEFVVLPGGSSRSAYEMSIDQAFRNNIDIVTVPRSVQERDSAWTAAMAESFWRNARGGKWLRLPEPIARRALDGVGSPDDVLPALHRLGLLNDEPDLPAILEGSEATMQ